MSLPRPTTAPAQAGLAVPEVPDFARVQTRIWAEEGEPDNAFATRLARCHGYDVFGQMLGRASWADMVYLLFTGQAPSPAQRALLDSMAVMLSNPGPRDPSVHAAMCGGVGGSTAAASLIAALSVGAGQCGGAREVVLAMTVWQSAGGVNGNVQACAQAWHDLLVQADTQEDVWPAVTHAPGFEPHPGAASTVVAQALAHLASQSPGTCLPWLLRERVALEAAAQRPLALTGVAAAAWLDLGLSPAQAEMLHLILRLPGAAAHTLEQGQGGFKQFPFPPLNLLDDPARAPSMTGQPGPTLTAQEAAP